MCPKMIEQILWMMASTMFFGANVYSTWNLFRGGK